MTALPEGAAVLPGLGHCPAAEPSVAVSDAAQTEAFFASAFAQYEGVTSVDREVAVIAEAPHSVWADVTWTFPSRPAERFCNQLVEGGDGFQIAVLTPLSVPTS